MMNTRNGQKLLALPIKSNKTLLAKRRITTIGIEQYMVTLKERGFGMWIIYEDMCKHV